MPAIWRIDSHALAPEAANVGTGRAPRKRRASGAVEGMLHPALLATLVYRFGRPDGATRASGSVMADGQCCLIHRDLLRQLGGF